MRRFTKVALLLAAISVLACGTAFALNHSPKLPVNLFSPTDVMLLSGDVERPVFADDFVTSGDATLLNFNVKIVSSAVALYDHGRSLDVILTNGGGVFSSSDLVAQSVSFDKILVRSTNKTIPMKFTVSVDSSTDGADNALALAESILFSLASPDLGKVSPDKAADCKVGCGNFEFFVQERTLTSQDITPFTPITITDARISWLGTDGADNEYAVQCCENFRLRASSDILGGVGATLSRDFVVAHLSETPLLRVRVADGYKIDRYVGTRLADDQLVSTDFRASYWKTDFFNTRGAVDVPEGKTYNMGVVYTISADCSQCEERVCDNTLGGYNLPFVAVTNLGTEFVWVEDNFKNDKLTYSGNNVSENKSWLCNIWGGLCTYDDMMSGDIGRFGGIQVGKDPNNLSHMYNFSCHLYPAFSNVWKGAGNMDFNYSAAKAEGNLGSSTVITRVRGRMNVAWQGDQLSTSVLCPSCRETGLYVYWPCPCSEVAYEDAIKTGSTLDLTFAKSSDVTLETFNQTAATGEYAAMEAVISLDKGLVKSSDVVAGTKGNVVLAKLAWNLSAANLSDAGLLNLSAGQWWREEMWNKMAIKLNGIKLDAASVTPVSGNDMTAEELSFLTVVNGPQVALNATSTVDVSLYVFVVDSDQSAVKYYKTAHGNRFLVVYDGTLDGKFNVRGSVVKGSGDAPVSADFALSATTLDLNIAVEAEKADTLTARNADGAVVRWSVVSNDFVVSNDIISINDTSGDIITVTGVAVGTAKVYASISGDVSKSADCTINVKEVAPTPSGDSSGGGCNVGFAPALLLLLAPLAFLKK